MTAKEARQISNKYDLHKFDEILRKIKECAENGERILHMYEPFSKWELELTDLGYTIHFASGISIQKENYYGSINW